ncbi:MAG: hypothetical protein RI637_05650 [Acidimicrobiia bacterium]|nr:hypothetical protein [Acidimicrobiia bacterium]
MTKRASKPRCGWCGGELPEQEGAGRRRVYCKQGCRQQAHMARKLAAAHGLGTDDLIISRKDLEELQGHLYGLQAALEDVDGDFEQARSAGLEFDYQDAYRWLYAGAQPLRFLWIEPRGT